MFPTITNNLFFHISTTYILVTIHRKLRSRKGNGIADQVLQNAPESCEVRVICEGKEVNEEITRVIVNDTSMSQKKDHQNDGVSSLSCVCFNFKA